MDESSILTLPVELLLLLAELLTGKDVIAFALTCKYFSDICRKLRSLSLEKFWNSGCSLENFKIFLTHSIESNLITQCNLNYCFWIPATLLQNFIKKCSNLEVLSISETKLNCGHLAVIFSKCKKITELSLTLSQNDLKITERELLSFNNTSSSDVSFPQPSCLRECKESLKNLVKLELVLYSSLQEMTVFVSFCDNIKELVLIPLTDNLRPTLNERLNEVRIGATLKGKFSLNSLTLVNLEEDVGVTLAPRRYQEYLVFKTNMKELTAYWNDACPCPVTKSKFSSLAFKHLRSPSGMFEIWWAERNNAPLWNVGNDFGAVEENVVDGWYLNDPLKNLDLTKIRSLREAVPVFIGQQLKAPQAKLISCFYSDEGFLEFCQNHSYLKVLKLKAPPTYDDWGNCISEAKFQVKNEWYQNSWKNFSELQALSIEPSLLSVIEPKVERPSRKRKLFDLPPMNQNLSPRTSPILEIVRSCLLIQELEISIFKEVTTDSTCRIDGEDLAHIAQCKLLKKLSFGNFFITDGIFLEEIINECAHLESLRLKNLGSPLLCCYTKNLCTSLPTAKKLTTLCIFQRNVVPLGKLLDAVEQCSSLTRLGLTTPSDTAPFKWTVNELAHRLRRLCTTLSQLVALFSVMNIPKSHSVKVTRQLQQHMIEKRPTFCGEIQASDKSRLEQESSTLPLIHRETLVRYHSRIGIVPFDYRCSLF